MNFSEFYQFSWFSNMAYVLWDADSVTNKTRMIEKANEAERVPSEPSANGPTLGQEIFMKSRGQSLSDPHELHGSH